MRNVRYSAAAFLLLLLLMPLNGQRTALLIVDIQDFYYPGGKVQLENPEIAGMNAGLLLDQFRKEGYPVYHIKHQFDPGGAIHSYVEPLPGETVITKHQVNAFVDTDLLSLLRADTIEQLVICGMQTHMCVEAAVRAGHDFGFDCILVEDACATRALQYQEYIIPARNVHFSTVQTLEGTYATVVTTEAFLRNLPQYIR